MAKIRGEIIIDVEKCKGCHVCVPACNFTCVEVSPKVNAKGYNFVVFQNQDACTGCANCAIVCPDTAITVYRAKVE